MNVYKAMGVNLPHGSVYLRTFRNNRPTTVVRDELRYGDILVYPGHVAIYTGEGTTAETAGSQVSRGAIWHRSEVVVRRFMDIPAGRSWENALYASRGLRSGRNRR
jgi:cell wall-associated NlpC family hydrolase